ncbi:MAG: helix-turn-helix domain-containing protein [Bacillales bacterium]|nr:helix-turn-helix domain-containing protein [Mollicutes bacterium]MCI7213258.1 helix-turn-helix domain-containing protein [Bacillales bacterium]MDD7715382.1 helix-turn-helix transcriptional regulator [Mollicutes bacterium]MDY3905048.1 helix-turn-helix transcriptional regulator [Candidatus Enteromonas sp.]MDY4935876.1 helix-turn-helix transcriptional regulator [Candidatus Enteromonas sp.]
MKTSEVKFKETLKAEMDKASLSSLGLSRALGVDEDRILAFLDGSKEPTFQELRLLSHIFLVSIDYLVKGE